MTSVSAISVEKLSHRYGERLALDELSFEVGAKSIFGLLGPNGGGKTTLFRILSTLLPVQSGSVRLLGLDVAADPAAVRERIGVTFQAPSLDKKLTVAENLKHQGHLYGLSGRDLHRRIDSILSRLGLAERRSDRVQSLSGGLARRVEIAKGLLHDPALLLLDEPSSGLDPGARLEVWKHLANLRDDSGVTVLVTTHFMEEAERCDRLALLDQGKLVADGTPGELRSSIGGDCLTIRTPHPEELSRRLSEKLGVQTQLVGDVLRLDVQRGPELIGRLMEAFGPEITSLSLAKPTLEDVFVERTGRGLGEGGISDFGFRK